MEQDKIFIDIDNLPKKLSSSETQELFIKMKNGDIQAKEKLATHNIRIVLYEVIKNIHSYECFEFAIFDLTSCNSKYLNWIDREVS